MKNIRKIIDKIDAAIFPFSKFNDANVGSSSERRRRYNENRERKGVILPYLNRWSQFSFLLIVFLNISEMGYMAQPVKSYVQALIGTSFAISVCVSGVLAVGWSFLHFVGDE